MMQTSTEMQYRYTVLFRHDRNDARTYAYMLRTLRYSRKTKKVRRRIPALMVGGASLLKERKSAGGAGNGPYVYGTGAVPYVQGLGNKWSPPLAFGPARGWDKRGHAYNTKSNHTVVHGTFTTGALRTIACR